ncbi:hypothetical protein GJ496_003570 [Pomphorhynchus laevis]|nr:hypothetical protein GJ496_003570 [Pomphorhynchus laevis]
MLQCTASKACVSSKTPQMNKKVEVIINYFTVHINNDKQNNFFATCLQVDPNSLFRINCSTKKDHSIVWYNLSEIGFKLRFMFAKTLSADNHQLSYSCEKNSLKRKYNDTFIAYGDRHEKCEDLDRICVVCGDISSGNHYGAPSCDGCRGFFKRCVRFGSDFACIRANGMCVISPATRTRCQSCRYQKCLAVGMTRGAVQIPRTHSTAKENFDIPSKLRRFECCKQFSQVQFSSESKCGSPIKNPDFPRITKTEEQYPPSFGFDITNLPRSECNDYDYSEPAPKHDVKPVQHQNPKLKRTSINVRLLSCGWIVDQDFTPEKRKSAFEIIIQTGADRKHENYIRDAINRLVDGVCSSRLCKDMPESDVLMTLQVVWRPLFLMLLALSDGYDALDVKLIGEDLCGLLKVIQLYAKGLQLKENPKLLKITVNMLIETAVRSSPLYMKYEEVMRSSILIFCDKLERMQGSNNLRDCAEIMALIGLCLCVMDKRIDSAVQWPGISNLDYILKRECKLRRQESSQYDVEN